METIQEVYNFLQSRRQLGIKPGLSRIEAMLDYFGQPDKKLTFIHIAGTNGKGSTLAFLSQVLKDSGYKVGAFTSPHALLQDHFQINQQSIDSYSIVHLVNLMKPIIDLLDQKNNPPSEFEILVMMATLHFYYEKVDIVLFEAAMGGREDCTNFINPILTIITNIGLDHVEFLGNSYEEIAKHKAGIIKKDVPLVVGETKSETMAIIKAEADDKAAPVIQYQKDFSVKCTQLNAEMEESFLFHSNNYSIPISLTMKGKHQVINASLACMALIILKERGLTISIKNIQHGLYRTSHPGRFEVISRKPTVILDGAHNLEGVITMIQTINEYYPNHKKLLLFAAFKDKPLDPMIKRMDEVFDKVMYTSFHHPRAERAEALYQLSHHNVKRIIPSWENFLQEYIKNGDDEAILCVTGSLNFIQVVRTYFVS